MGTEHMGYAMQQRRQVAGHVGVPGMGMDQVRSGDVRHDAQIHPEGLDSGIRRPQIIRSGIRRHRCTVVVRITGRAEGTHLQIHMLRQDAAELGNMHTGPAIDFGWKLFSHNVYAHAT